MLVVACSLAVATAAIAGSGPGEADVAGGPIGAAPRTPVIDRGPDNPTVSTSATFWFAARGFKGGYECKLDSNEFTECTSPHSYSGLGVGVHTFQVVAVMDDYRSTPAHYLWSIEPPSTPPPATPTIESAPASETDNFSAYLSFSSETPDVTFFCRLDGGDFENCRSPKRYHKLDYGRHTFEVKARNAANMDSGTASVNWMVVNLPPVPSPPPAPPAPPPAPTPPATPTIDSGPPSVTIETNATFTFSSTTAGVSYLCRLDTAAFASCTSPKGYTALAVGTHVFEVKARDAGLLESGVAAQTWRIAEASPPAPEPPPAPTAPPRRRSSPARRVRPPIPRRSSGSPARPAESPTSAGSTRLRSRPVRAPRAIPGSLSAITGSR